MKKSVITWPMLLTGFVLFFIAGIVLWFLHGLFHDSIGISLLLLWVVAVVAFWATVLANCAQVIQADLAEGLMLGMTRP